MLPAQEGHRSVSPLREAVAKVLPSVVTIETSAIRFLDGQPPGRKRHVEETGIGIAIDFDGTTCVVTNYHVVADVDSEEIKLILHDRRFLTATAVARNEEFDIAIIKVAAPIPPAPIGDSDLIEQTDPVLALGSPFGLKESVSRGIISAKERRSIPSGNHQMPLQGFFQTDAAINPGNSGGPLITPDGKVIGLVTAIASSGGGSEGVAFAMPINNVMRIARQLVERGVVSRPYLGVELDPKFDLGAHKAAGLDRMIGTKIMRVQSGSPAEEAGIRPGDIVLRCDHVEIEDNLHFIHRIAQGREGDMPEIVLLREGKPYRCRPRLTLQMSR